VLKQKNSVEFSKLHSTYPESRVEEKNFLEKKQKLTVFAGFWQEIFCIVGIRFLGMPELNSTYAEKIFEEKNFLEKLSSSDFFPSVDESCLIFSQVYFGRVANLHSTLRVHRFSQEIFEKTLF